MEPYVGKDEFHKYVMDNRDRQDSNKTEIIETLEKAIEKSVSPIADDIDDVCARVLVLEGDAKKQTFLSTIIASVTAVIVGLITQEVGGK
jgi:hypothetical protein